MTTPLRVLQITDSHLFGPDEGRLAGVDTEASWEAVLERVYASPSWPADLVLFTGDLVHEGAPDGYRRAKAYLDALGVETLVIPGNHDDPAALQAAFAEGAATAVGHRIVGSWLFVMLDSTIPGAVEGRLEPEELERLDRVLGAHPDHHALVCLHHHPIALGCRWIDAIGLTNADALLCRLRAHATVRAVLCGHVHQESERRIDGRVRVLSAPSTCVQFDPHTDEFGVDPQPPGFRWLELQPDGALTTRVERLEAVPQGLDAGIGGY